MTAFAYYRLPCEQHATYVAQHVGEPEILSSVAQLNGKEGFVIAPFQPSAECPVVLIHPDEKKVIHLTGENFEGNLGEKNSDGGQNGGLKGNEKSEGKDGYVRDFGCFHEQLQKGVFRKIVLARRSVQTTRLSAEALFAKACRMYPRLFVALVCSEASGMWLMATPEVLLNGRAGEYHTMSLAGTQKAPMTSVCPIPHEATEGLEWPQKDQEEQQYVTDYIEACIRTFSDDYRLQGPYTMTAAHLCHLRTDIHFRLPCATCWAMCSKRSIPRQPCVAFPRSQPAGLSCVMSTSPVGTTVVSWACCRPVPIPISSCRSAVCVFCLAASASSMPVAAS